MTKPNLSATLQTAVASHNRGDLAHAELLYKAVLAEAPDNFDALVLLGLIANERAAPARAIKLFDRALRVNDKSAVALSSRGLALRELNRLNEALATFERALQFAPDHFQAQANRALVLSDLGRHDESLAAYDAAIALRPDEAGAHFNRGKVLRDLGRHEAALASYDRAIALAPGFAAAFNDRGAVLTELHRFEEAALSYDRAISLSPDYATVQPFLLGDWIHARMKVCDWSGLDPAFDRAREAIDAGTPASTPFAALSMPLSAGQQLACAKTFSRLRGPAQASPLRPRKKVERLRIGYFSSDLREHAIAHCIAEMIALHDRSQFEPVAFALTPAREDTMRSRLRETFDQFVDVGALSDAEIAKRARAMEIDIAIDLQGYTGRTRPGVFAHRAAPIQASHLGYPGTMGAEYIDYLIADHVVVPDEHQAFYSEKIAYLPHAYLPRDRARDPGDARMTRQQAGLPEDAFVFCAFSNSYKITPREFDVWMRLLRDTPGAVLWLIADSALMTRNLQREAKARDVDPERLIFAPRVEGPAQHLARQRLSDIFLDTFTYNAHSSAADALWVGLPVLTLPGETFASRVAASLLTALGLPELIADTLETYEASALRFARDRAKLDDLRRRVADHRSSFPLFDTALFTRNLEQVYRRMWERRTAGLPAASFVVAPEHQGDHTPA